MSYHPDVLAQGVDEISFHTLHMVDIILVLEIGAIDLGKQLQRLSRIREQVARIFEAVHGLDDHAKPCPGSTIGSPGEILTHMGTRQIIEDHDLFAHGGETVGDVGA